MALQGSGQISYSNITDEFGSPGNGGLGAYRVSQNVGNLTNLGLDNSTANPPASTMPQSGQISFSDFYNGRLNIVVDHHSGGTVYRQNSRSRYNNNDVTVIGGFRSRPSNSSGKQVIIHVNKTIGSEKSGNDHCALRTGGWDSNTELSVDIGSSGRLRGAGGNGGNGSRESGQNGGTGSSGLGVEYSPCKVNIRSGGLISAGWGGGGGGGGAHDHDKGSERNAGGGGGGGGAGFPAGNGGSGTTGGGNGTDGSTDGAGEGGNNHNNGGEAISGPGGEGGSNGEEANNGGDGEGGEGQEHEGGSGGGDGIAIRRTNSGFTVNISNSGTIRPSSSLGTGVG